MGAYYLRTRSIGVPPDPGAAIPALPPVRPLVAPDTADDSGEDSAGSDALGSFADRLGGFGTDTTGDDRRNALRQAMIQAGLTIASHAGTQGLGALAPGLLGGFQSYKGSLEQTEQGNAAAAKQAAIEEDRKARLAIDQGRYQMESQDRQASIAEKQGAAAAILDNKKAALDRHSAMLAQIKDPDLKEQLAPLAGDQTGAFEKAYAASIRPENQKHNYQVVGRSLVDLSDPSHAVFTAPSDPKAGEPGWAIEKMDDRLVRVNKYTGAASEIDIPTGTGLTRGEKQQANQDAKTIYNSLEKKLILAGKDYEPAQLMNQAHQQATDGILARRAARPGAPSAATPSAPTAAGPFSPKEIEARVRQRYAGQPESVIQAALAETIKKLVP